MMPDSSSLLPLQRAAVIALKPFACRDTEIREATTVTTLYTEARRARRTLATTRFIATQCGPAAARPIFAITQPAFDALVDLLGACERETKFQEERPCEP